jgi:hypothetical protein
LDHSSGAAQAFKEAALFNLLVSFEFHTTNDRRICTQLADQYSTKDFWIDKIFPR